MRLYHRRVIRVLPATLVFWLLSVEVALGAAGGGSSGFGGGGGGGGGFSGGGGGGGFSGGGGSSGGSWFGGLFVILLFAAILLIGAFGTIKVQRKRKARLAQVRLASAEAAENDPAFGPDVLVPAAEELFLAAQRAWDARDRAALQQLVGEDLLVEWKRRLDDFDAKGWHNRVQVHERPEVAYVGLVNREADQEDRAVVQINARLDDYVLDSMGNVIEKNGATSKQTQLSEFWTLAKRDGRWIVTSIESSIEGAHNWDAEIVASPWSDSRVHDEAVVEVATSDPLPPGFKPALLADLDFDGTARAAALDLSVADPRFTPDLLEAAARRAVEAWAGAVDGDDAPLDAAATSEAVTALLYSGDTARKTRLVIRGPRVKQIRIVALDAGSEPARMTLEVDLGGVRYVEDRDTAAVVSGSRELPMVFTERWTLTLDGSPDMPWRIAEVAGMGAAA